MNLMPSLWPGEVESYDAVNRTCRVRIPGITDGSNTLPEAVFVNPLGDRAGDTEIRILAGDLVWLMFEGGDPRFPIIAGYRTPREGNPTQWRRWRHANIEMTADGELVINATNVTWNISGNETRTVGGNVTETVTGSVSETVSGGVTETISGGQTTNVTGTLATTATTSTHQATSHTLTAATTIAGALASTSGPGGSGAQFSGSVQFNGESVTHGGVNIGATHAHQENDMAPGLTGTAQ